MLAGDFAKYVLHSFVMQGKVFVCDEVAESLFDAQTYIWLLHFGILR